MGRISPPTSPWPLTLAVPRRSCSQRRICSLSFAERSYVSNPNAIPRDSYERSRFSWSICRRWWETIDASGLNGGAVARITRETIETRPRETIRPQKWWDIKSLITFPRWDRAWDRAVTEYSNITADNFLLRKKIYVCKSLKLRRRYSVCYARTR